MKFSLNVTCLLLFCYTCFGFQSPKSNTDSMAIYSEKGSSIKALNYARKQSLYFLNAKKYNDYCLLMIKKANFYQNVNDSENALETLYQAKAIAEKQQLEANLFELYRQIGIVNARIFEYKKSISNFKKAERIALKLNDEKKLTDIYRAYYAIYETIKLDSCKYYIDKTIYHSRNDKNFETSYKNNNNLATYYININENKKAKFFIDSSNYYAKKTGNKIYQSAVLNNLAFLYMTVDKDYIKAINMYYEILKMFPNDKSSNEVKDSYLNLSYAYEKIGDYKNGLLYMNKYYELHDELYSGQLSKRSEEIETKYQIEKIENEYKDKQLKIVAEQKANERLLLIFASLFILAGFIFYFYYQNLMLRQKNKIKEKDSELQYKIISASLDGQDEERNKISAVLHDSVSAILSSVGLHLSAFESDLTPQQIQDLKKTRSLLKDAHDKVRDLSHQLVPPLLMKLGLKYAFKDLCDKYSNSLLQITFTTSLPRDRRFSLDFETKIYFIVSELLNNIIKHSSASKATLSIEEVKSRLYITITDNGKGFDVKNSNKSNGFGLTQIRARIKNMQGDIEIHSEKNEGTSVSIMVNT